MPATDHVVLETGSATTRAGFGGGLAPKVTLPTVLGRDKDNKVVQIGEEAQRQKDTLSLSSPVQDGKIANWDDIEILWRKVLQEQLATSPENHKILLLDSPCLDREAREKMAKVMFDSFNVPALFIANQAVCSSYSAGRLNALVVEMGEAGIYAVPVLDGFAVPKAVRHWAFGGSGQTEYLGKLLAAKGYNLPADTVRAVKEASCYVAMSYKAEMGKTSLENFDKTFKVQDAEVTLGKEMFETAEVLFQPSLAGQTGEGIVALVKDAILACDSDKHKVLFENIILSGGPSMSPGMDPRLKQDLTRATGQKVDVVASPQRINSAWLGGSVLAVHENFDSMWLTQEEYRAKGPSVIHEKCK